jgi:serine phosphatase RsbU (regulator of sigma subunit)/CheY-like chemotaxis protein
MNPDSPQKLKMLIVDDEPDNLDLLYRTFRLDFQVLRAESAPAALELLEKQGEVAIIISDQRMPEMLGTEFLSRTVDRFPDTIRIVLTAYTDVKDLVDAINSGKVFKYITKPWNQQQLQAVIQQAAETYRMVKQRTDVLQRALRRESVFNAITTAIRGSLDYASISQTIVQTMGESFNADRGILHPVEDFQVLRKSFSYNMPEAEAPLVASEAVTQSALAASQQAPEIKAVYQTESDTHHLVVPFQDQSQLLGLLDLQRSGKAKSWGTDETQFIGEVAQQAALAMSQAKLYLRTQQQAEKMRAELEVARQIQNNLLRQSLPILDQMKVQACCQPAREVGGDFFEVYSHPQGDLWLAVGDVSGKGVPAALFMASAISVLRRELAQEVSPDPDEVMRNLNRILLEDLMSTNCFITMVIARYNQQTQTLTYANAGHLYPMVWSGYHPVEQEEPQYLKTRGIPLGILPQWKAKSGECQVKPGEIFLLTSDGVTEATVKSGGDSNIPGSTFLQQDGLWQLLRQHPETFDLQDLLAQIRAQTTAQDDDQTMLSLEVL